MNKAEILNEKKKKIEEIIRQKGPSLPMQISRELGMESIFVSAILSEMVGNKQLKISSMKVGSSPLYYLQGQEQELEKFVRFLPGKEKEVFELIKKKGIVCDDELSPAHRIAIRSLKDFAVPFRTKEKIFWRFYSAEEKEIKKEEKKEEKKEKKEKEEKKEEKERKERNEFIRKIEKFLQENKIKIFEERERKKKETSMIVSVDLGIEKINALLVAKNKKIINEADIMLALDKSQTEKMPIFFLTNGKPTKKASLLIEKFKNLFIFRQI